MHMVFFLMRVLNPYWEQNDLQNVPWIQMIEL